MHEVSKPKKVFVTGEQFHYYKSWCPGIYRRIDREVETCKINIKEKLILIQVSQNADDSIPCKSQVELPLVGHAE